MRETLQAPPKTPTNSGTPPSQGRKANGDGKPSPKTRVHAGAHRPLHPNPTRCEAIRMEHCPHCRADLGEVEQVAVQTYDRVEIPEIAPDVTRVVLHGGVCPCCAGRFKAAAPAGLEPGSPFGPNLRAFVLYGFLEMWQRPLTCGGAVRAHQAPSGSRRAARSNCFRRLGISPAGLGLLKR
ncbi:hypothetical protein [Paracraurococcus lichenis]|uniref:Transposase IS66 zinc-finger binding domain-containing protein n=1 Tax=Paracraurococcus lichenis TaxID=3064888 RepID=A0ABT9EBN8_9PROT|nr:hypothetical protein [Paracraurococcus sp. LOR1-02]MDO9713562.1 hypothetical protein [Paracraurococcus sp. LOR1-02]